MPPLPIIARVAALLTFVLLTSITHAQSPTDPPPPTDPPATAAALQTDAAAAPPADAIAFFESRIRPLLIAHCIDCHGPETAEGKLRLDSKQGWQRGGEQGPAIVPGDPSASLLIRLVAYRPQELKMPPEDAGGKLTDQQIADLTTWVRQGAHDPRVGDQVVTDIEAAARDHWAFRPITPPPITPPEIGPNANPIDLLIGRNLHDRGFRATEPADMPTLIRRATFDLHGLPPTFAQNQTAREDFPKLVRELLASPRYGERWGRHWLDVARYSDAKDGVLMYGDARIRPFAYTYRDYVIRAFNDDKPFDRFVHEQLAADKLSLPPDAPELAGLGLLTLGRMFDRNLHDVIDDQIDVISRGFLGLTVSCARCHDHKFDPIPTADYYSLYGVLASCIEPYDRPRIGPLTDAGKPFEDEFAAKLKQVVDQQQTHYDEVLKTARERTADYLVQAATTEPDVAETAIFFLSLIPDQLRPQVTRRWRQTIAKRAFPDDPVFGPWADLVAEISRQPMAPISPQTERWRQNGVDPRIIDGLVAANPQTVADVAKAYGQILVDAWKKAEAAADPADPAAIDADPLASLLVSRSGPVWFPKQDVANYLSRTPGDAYRGLLGELDAIAVKHPDAAARAMVLWDAEVLCDPVIFQRGDPIQRGAPVPRQFLAAVSTQPRSPFQSGSGRLELAQAIASPQNPLTARVWVNRVWMHHFGQPLVDSPSDFGLQTPRPLQHELLDFLADFLIKNGWRTKPLHELIMTSDAYRRDSRLGDDPAFREQLTADPNNTHLWRGNRQRLDFEQMRDTLLMVSGDLDPTMYGRPKVLTDESNHRRTIYAFVERQNIPAVVQTFDVATADTSTARRVTTTVPQQALFAMNSQFMLGRSRALAGRVAALASVDPVGVLYEAVYGRRPSDDERQLANEFLREGTTEQFAQALLMSNELMFID
jgi:cytochrome c553